MDYYLTLETNKIKKLIQKRVDGSRRGYCNKYDKLQIANELALTYKCKVKIIPYVN